MDVIWEEATKLFLLSQLLRIVQSVWIVTADLYTTTSNTTIVATIATAANTAIVATIATTANTTIVATTATTDPELVGPQIEIRPIMDSGVRVRHISMMAVEVFVMTGLTTESQRPVLQILLSVTGLPPLLST